MPTVEDVMPSQQASAQPDDEVLPSLRTPTTTTAELMPSQSAATPPGAEVMPSQRTATFQPMQINPTAPGGFNYGGKNTKISPDAGDDELQAELGRTIGQPLYRTGAAIRGALADVGELVAHEPDESYLRNTQAAISGDPVNLPTDIAQKNLPTALRVVGAADKGLIQTLPNLALTAVAPPVGIASFGMQPEGFDPKQAAWAAALPVIGKYTGAITEAIASKAGVTKDAALNIWNRIGGATGAATAIGADQIHQISQLPADQQKDALIDAAGNVGSMFVLGALGERTQLADTAAGKAIAKWRAPTDADTLEQDLADGSTPLQTPEALTPAQSMAREGVQAMAALRAQKADDVPETPAAPVAADAVSIPSTTIEAPKMDMAAEPAARDSVAEQDANNQGTAPAAETADEPMPSSKPATVTEDHLAQARDALTTEKPPTVQDDIAGAVTSGPVKFPAADFTDTISATRDALSNELYQKDYKSISTTQRAKVDKLHGMSTSDGMPADEVLQGLASDNPKYRDWTTDDLAQAMSNVSAKTEDTPAVRQLAQEIAPAEQSKPKAAATAAAPWTAPKGEVKAEQPKIQGPKAVTMDAIPESVKQSVNKWKDAILTFQGGKRKMAAITSHFIRKIWPEAQRNSINEIHDYFGGSGGWGLFNAMVNFPKVRRLLIHEYEPDRMLKINLFHDQGKNFQKLFESSQVSKDRPVILEEMKNQGVTSANAFSDRMRKRMVSYRNPMDRAIAQALIDHGDASFATASLKHMVRLVGENAAKTQAMADAFRARGGNIEYAKPGDSFAIQPPTDPHALAMVDPPYPDTAGYQTSRVGLGIFNKTAGLLARLKAAQNHVVYTDSAWWNAPEVQRDFELDNSLNTVNGSLTHRALVDEGKNEIILGANNEYARGSTSSQRARSGQPVPGRETERPLSATGGVHDREGEAAGGMAAGAAPETAPVDTARAGVLDRAESAIKGRLNEIAGEGRLFTGLDPEELLLRAAHGAILIARGVKDFAEWSGQMVAKFGPEIQKHLNDLWTKSQSLVNGADQDHGLSQRGMKIIGDLETSQAVTDKINPIYQKLTDKSAADQAKTIGQNYPKAEDLANDMLAGKFADAPGGIEVALLANAARRLADEQKLAEKTGNAGRADMLAQKQIDLLNRFREQSTDMAQALQKHQLLYENFSPAAWLKNFRDMISKTAAERVERAGGLDKGSVDPSPIGISSAIAEHIAQQFDASHPKLAQAIREFYGFNPRPPMTLADYLKQKGLTEVMAKAKAKKLEDLYVKEVNKFRTRHGIPDFDNATEREVLRRAKAIDELPRDSVQRTTATQDLQNWLVKTKGFDWWEPARELWYGNILSGPTTVWKIFRSTAINAGAETGVQMLRHPTAIPQIIKALAHALPRSSEEAVRVMKTGFSGRAGDIFDHPTWMETRTGWQSKVLAPWKAVFRSHHALHALTYYPLEEAKALVLTRDAIQREGVPVFGGQVAKIAAQKMQWLSEQHDAAAKQATDEGLTKGGKLFQSRVRQILSQKRDTTVMMNAREFALNGTYTNDTYGILGAAGDNFNKFAMDYPVARLAVPFVRIPLNLFNGMLNWTPVGAWRAARGQGFKLLVGKDERTGTMFGKAVTDPTAVADEYARATIGTLAAVGLYSAGMALVNSANPPFMVTARGPTDQNHRRLLEQAGWIPNSIKIGDKYIPYLDTPAAIVLSYIGHTMDALRYNKLDHQDALSRAIFAASSIRSVIFDSTWAQGLSSLFDTDSYASNKNMGEKGAQQAIRTASGFVVPNAVKQLDQLFDPTVYKADDIEAMLMTQIPFARSAGEPDLNVFGEPVQNPLLSRVYSQVKGDAMTQTLAGLRLWPSVPVEPDLTPSEQRQLLKTRGPQLRAALTASLPQLQTMLPSQAQKLVTKISEQTTLQAKKALGFDNLVRERNAANK